MSTSVTPQGKSIQTLYREYREGKLIVNRRYQRKLVWSIQEKQHLIDSILKEYPVPLILLAEITTPTGDRQYEIIDGMQRLNAVFTFIENSFEYQGKYFNVNEFARARQLSEDGLFQIKTDVSLLSPEECANFLDYQLAITIYPTNEEAKITDVFSRINSAGRQLSPQEQRQAGVVNNFSKLIRILASELRGDVSKDVLLLSEMPEISVDTAKSPHGYGIQAEQTFWCRQGILSIKQLKESDDEQFLADICASILNGQPLPASQELFNKLYDMQTEESKSLEAKLIHYGSDRLAREIKSIVSIILDLIENVGKDAYYLRKLVRPGQNTPIKTPFYAIFMAFYNLVVVGSKSPDQPDKIFQALEKLDLKLVKGSHYETTENRQKNINVTKGLIQDYFVDKIPPILGHGPSLSIDVENAFRRSRIETSRYEFKQGILDLDDRRGMNSELIKRLIETACAIANLGPSGEGYIFIGVADREAHAERIETLDGVRKTKIADQYVVGIDREAGILKKSLEEYTKIIIDAFKQSNITEPLKTQLLASFDVVLVRNMSVLRIRIPNQSDVSFVNDKAYMRQGSETIEVVGPQLLSMSKLFKGV